MRDDAFKFAPIPRADIDLKQKVEIEFWRDSKRESPGSDSIHNIINKVSTAGVFVDCLNRYKDKFRGDGRILELGAGQGWASCIYKRLYPNSFVTATDISPFAVMSLPKWERIFDVKIENSYACNSYDIHENDASFDQIFCFAAAHHFLAHKRTLRDIKRVLKPGGRAFYLFEPTSPKYLYSLAYWRVNKKRPDVPEDVLIPSKLRKIAEDLGLECQVDFYPAFKARGTIETVYYIVLARVAFLQTMLPCTANFIFTKSKREERNHSFKADARGLFDELKKALAERMLNAEMDHHLTQEAAEPDRNQANHRNGYSKKTVLTDAAKIEIAVPRDRAGTFDPQLIAKYRRRFPGFDEKIVSM